MRLIDADHILGSGPYIQVDDDFNSYIMLDDLLKLIGEQPTAYDVDAVVNQLKNYEMTAARAEMYEDYFATAQVFKGKRLAYGQAIKIVKGGGVE